MAFRDTPFFSWSPVREEMFYECQLCYILHYYTSHKGWLKSSSVDSRAAYRFKQARKVEDLMFETFIYTLVDDIYSKDKITLKETQRKVLQTINNSFKESVNKKEDWYDNPKKIDMLYELVYEDKFEDAVVKKTTSKLNGFLRNFLQSQLIKDLSSNKNKLVEVRKNFRGGFSYFHLEPYGIRCYAGVHTVHKRKDGTYVATLFKTNDKPSSTSQIGAVAKIVADVLKIDIKKITIRDEFLINATYKDYKITDTLIKKTKESIIKSIEEMRELLLEGDLERNEFIGFESDYTRSKAHLKAEKDKCTMDVCPYCEAVRRDLELYPHGYDSSIAVLKYSKSHLKVS